MQLSKNITIQIDSWYIAHLLASETEVGDISCDNKVCIALTDRHVTFVLIINLLLQKLVNMLSTRC